MRKSFERIAKHFKLRSANFFERKCQSQAENILSKYPFLNEDEWKYVNQLGNRVYKLTGGVVYSGPFSEMKLKENSFLTSRPIWVVGCYEEEIETALCDLITDPPTNIVDIGSAHGYYMVGLATQIAGIEIVGFEAVEHPHWHEARLLAELNGVSDRVIQKGICDTDSLNLAVKERGAIIIDCEGGEIDLLDPIKSPVLKTCRIICELHDFYRPGITRELIERFRDTHRIEIIFEKSRDHKKFRVLDGFTPAERTLCIKESKHISDRFTAGRFLWMRPKVQ